MKRIAIIGGGIAGLSAAYYLERARASGADLEWTLFERSERFGGVIQTELRDGFVLEAGPDSFLTIKPEAAQLCRDLGLGHQLISSNDARRKTYIAVKERLIPIPDGLEFMVPTRIWPMARTRLFSFGTKLRMAREMFASPRGGSRVGSEDESVASFVLRHFGAEMVERVAEPLLAGVYGGDAATLSVRAVLPRFADMEREHGSLVRATLHAHRQRARLQGKTKAPPPSLFTSLKGGMQQMVDAILAALPAPWLRLRYPVSALRQAGDEWQVESAEAETSDRFHNVVLAAPATAAAELLRAIRPELAENLDKITYTSSAAVALAYDHLDLPPGFGFLVPRSEGHKMLACTFVHRKFPHRAPEGSALLRCFFSSSRVRGWQGYSEAALLDLAQRELTDIMGLRATPRFARVFRWACGLPQYATGHLERVAEMEKSLSGLPGLHIIGNSFYGIGVPDCIRSGMKAAAAINAAALQPASV
jgi:oxygen-dependent protoporphyrinogen oxidase